MDVEKEREAFEATSPFSIYINKVNSDGNKYTPIYYKDLDYAQIMSFGWLAWQAAKTQAVPEGFVLVDKHQLAQLMANMDSFGKKALGDDYVSFADIAEVLDEAREPAND